MTLMQLTRSIVVRSERRTMLRALFGVAICLLPARDLYAQALQPTKLELGFAPTVQVVPEKLAGSSVWAGGFTPSVTYRFHQMFAAEASVLGAFAPQLNYKASSVLNSINTSLSIEFHQKSVHPWDPYVSGGLGRASFRYIDAPEGFPGNSEYMYERGAVGVRYALNERINWRAEISRQFSNLGASNTFMSGVSLRVRSKVKS